MTKRSTILAAALALSLAACSSAPPTHERGWVGGRFAPVSRGEGLFAPDAPALTGGGGVVGMPAGVEAEGGLLVTDLPADSPLAAAGVVRGDLLLTVDGEPVGSPDDLRDGIEDRAPGAPVRLGIWRDGAERETTVTVGRERYEKRVSVGIGLFLAPEIDLWPFDDGVSVLGVVAFRTRDLRTEPSAAALSYLAASHPDAGIGFPDQESVTLRILPLSLGTSKRVTSRER